MSRIQIKIAAGGDMGVAARLAKIFEAIVREREFQTDKYGPVIEPGLKSATGMPITDHKQGPGGHELGAWLVILESELDEAKKALVHGGSKSVKGRDTIRAEIVQIAAVAIAALEQHGVEE